MKRSGLLDLQRTDWRVLASATGIAAAAVLAWFLAPLIEVAGQAPLTTPPARLLAVATVLGLAGAILLAERALAIHRNRAFLAQLAPNESGRREVAFLGKRFVQALAQLRSLRAVRHGSGLRRLAVLLGRPLVHELPWYVIIGAPGAGKTTVLLNSGLHFPLADESGRESVRGVGGTRNCDWWFASEAVLIDTAGRYTTQDSDRDADRTAWLGFLDLLRRHRPRRPINGVLLAVSASDLLQATPERMAAHAAELRQRLDEISARLDLEVPVYVLVTKTDLLPGFSEFFADFDQNVRAQVWGATLPRDAGAAQWRGEMDALEARLHEQMLERLGSERGRPHSAAIHAFPARWRGLNRAALDLLHAVGSLEGGPAGGAQPILRGLYFTSATQDAAPQQRADGTASYFVTRLLRDVVFAESGLAGSTSRRSRQRRLIERGALAASAVAMVLALGTTWRGYERQVRAVDAFAGQLPGLDSALAQAQRANDLTALLPALDALAGSGLDRVDNGDLTDRLLDRVDMLAAAADDSYQRLLKDAFLPRLAARLEERLRKSAGEPAARTYETLRAYLMLFGGKHFDRAALRDYFVNDWKLTLPETVSAAERAALLRHLDQLLGGGEVGAPSLADARLVAQVRERVQGVPLAQRAATRLQQQQANAPRVALNAAGVLVRASGGALAEVASPRAATAPAAQRPREHTQQVLTALAHEQSWVLGLPPAAPAAPGLVDEVERLVALDNAQYWQSVLDDLRLAPTPRLADSARLARALAQADSPLLTLLRTATRETADGPSAAWFAALRAHVDGASPPAARLQALLGKLAAHLAAADDAAQRHALPPASDVMRELALAARDAPAPLNVLLAQLQTTSANQLLGAVREPLSREIARELAPACTRAVSQRYPFVRNASEDMTRDDFTRTFGAGGLFDAFFQRHLAAHADAARSDAAAPFRRAQTIREAFFRDGGRALGTRLEFRLLELDAGASEFTLEVDGQAMRFKRGTQQTQSIDWLTFGGRTVQNGQSGPAGRVHVLLAPSAGSGYTFNGPWALLRLLDRARVERGASPDRALISFDIEGRKARFEVRSAGAHNPLLRQDLEPFQCPNKL
jgi:type VI secretion system protein ImpL